MFIPVVARVIAPFNYGHLTVAGGVSTIPEFINDKAICFGLCASLGALNQRPVMFAKDYAGDMLAMPWRTSVFSTDDPKLLPPLARRSDLSVEGGRTNNIIRATSSGNFKEYFQIQEVPENQVFHGAIFGENPFEISGLDTLILRIGSNRSGLLKLSIATTPRKVRLNLATGRLFEQNNLKMERYLLHEFQLSEELELSEAYEEVKKWN
jgi:hypothetical protein